MKSSVLILAVVAVILIAGGAFAFVFIDDIADIADGGNSGTFHKVADKVDQVTSSDSSSSDGGSDIVSEVVKFNYQAGDGWYRDNATGELIGSSYDEDQEKLGVIDGNLE